LGGGGFVFFFFFWGGGGGTGPLFPLSHTPSLGLLFLSPALFKQERTAVSLFSLYPRVRFSEISPLRGVHVFPPIHTLRRLILSPLPLTNSPGPLSCPMFVFSFHEERCHFDHKILSPGFSFHSPLFSHKERSRSPFFSVQVTVCKAKEVFFLFPHFWRRRSEWPSAASSANKPFHD